MIIPAAVAGATLGLGLYKTLKADAELKKLQKKPLAQFGEVPALTASRNRADVMSLKGFTASEDANWRQQLAQGQNTAYNKATQTAPNMAGVISAGINYGNVGAINQHAAADAQLHRQNIKYADTFSQYLQQLNNQNIQEQLNMTKMAFGALGEGKQAGINMIGSAPGQFAAIYTAGMGADGKTPSPTTPVSSLTPNAAMPNQPSLDMGYRIPQEIPNENAPSIYPEFNLTERQRKIKALGGAINP